MKSCRPIVFVLSAVVALVLLMNLLTPAVYHVLPNDYARTRLILRVLDASSPDVVLLGNSRGMSGLDANRLEAALGLECLNCCSVSQTLAESMLYLERLPESVRVVVQCIDEKEFTANALCLNEPAAVAFSMNGYRPEPLARELLRPVDMKRLVEHPLLRNFHSRGALRSGVSKILIRCLDDDAPGKAMADMKYPYIYPSEHSGTYDRDMQLQRLYLPDSTTVFNLPDVLGSYCAKLNSYLSSRNIRLVFVLMPNCPGLHWPAEAVTHWRRSVADLLGDALRIDAFDALPEEGFYDPLHPNRTGGRLLSDFVGDALKKILDIQP